MALNSDSQGFLIGNVVTDIVRSNRILTSIQKDIRSIKNAWLMSNSNSSGSNQANGGAVTPPSRSRDRASSAATPIRRGANSPDILPPAPRNTVTPNGRDASTGRFTGNGGIGSVSNSASSRDDKKSQSIISNLAGRLANTASGAANGAEEADPAIKAFKEVSEPLMRGYQTLSGGGDKKDRWYKKIFKELNLFRKDETVFNRAANRSLHNIEGNPGGGGGDSSGGILMALAGLLGRLGPMLLTGITAVLGFVFSPIGLAISAAGAVAWGLFTEDGQKFFGEVGAKIIAGWEVVTTAFAPITESMSKGWDTVKGGFDSLISGMVSSWDTFTAFLKDKFGIDIPAIAKPVIDAGKKVVEGAKETVKSGVDAAKEAGGKAVNAISESSPKTTVALGKAKDWLMGKASPILEAGKEGAGNIARRAKFNEVEAAQNFKGGDQITGLSDVQTRALAANTSKTESAGKVDADNKQGYFGQYQFGAEALVESGMVKQDNLAAAKKASGKDWYKKRTANGEMGGHEAFLRDKSNWNTEGGLDAFLQDKEQQDQAFVKYTNKNVAGGIRSGAISNGDSAEKIAGYSKAAHLKGVGGANKLFKDGIESTDGNGTSTATYAKQAAEAMTTTVASINAAPSLHDRAAGPGNAAYTAYAAAPNVPTFGTVPALAEVPPIKQPLASNSDRGSAASAPSMDVGQDIKDRNIAHIVTGGFSGRG